jgi:thiosulfate dehydrogenase
MEDIPKRVNDCFERSLNGKALDTGGVEMKAIVAYMNWLGTDVPKSHKPTGSGIKKVEFMERAADPVKGELVYQEKCQSCHMADGEGILKADGNEYQYPPLWGENSYNTGAGLFRMSNFAGYVKANMPFGTSFKFPILSDEDSWDVAAFVNSKPRPVRDLSADWPDISKKPFDHPFGPYADPFPETQHKYGPYKPITD